MVFDAIIDSPIGKLGLVMRGQVLTELHFIDDDIECTHTDLSPIAEQLSAYFTNPHHHISLPTQAAGTDFQHRVWRALQNIPSGTTLTYGELAKQLHSSPRAVGQACRRNPLPIIVPCHRVTAAKHLGGYAGDTIGKLPEIKQWLLKYESCSE